MKTPNTLRESIIFFSDYENCRQFMVDLRWPGGAVQCPHCGSEKVTYLEKARVYRCYGDHPKQKFSLKVGTIFEDSPIPLQKWLPAVWMLVNCKNGISSYELHRALGVTQKSAWFMLHRIRLAMQSKSFLKIGGFGKEVEADETYIGGKARNMHMAPKKRRITGHGAVDKAAVLGLLERGGEIRAMTVPNIKTYRLQSEVHKNVEAGSALYTDELKSYRGLDAMYVHGVINHAAAYVDGRIHTNGLENFWSLLKRGLSGTYVSVEPFHLFRYLDEQTWRYNHRAKPEINVNDGDRFLMALSQIVGKRLTFEELTGKVGERAA